MEQRYKFSIESKSFPLDISGEPVSELWKVMNDSELHLYDDYCVEGAIKYKWDEDRQALTFDNDGWYSSDFNSLAVL